MTKPKTRKHVREKQDEPGKYIPMTHKTGADERERVFGFGPNTIAEFPYIFEKSGLELNTTAKTLLDNWAKETLKRDREWFRQQVEKYYLDAMRNYINEELDK
jgi:hypothetical protein